MDGTTKKAVVYSDFIETDLQEIFNYGKETFGILQAELYLLKLIGEIDLLECRYLQHPCCRYLVTKSKMYRNIIVGSHIVIYRISEKIEILRILHSFSANNRLRKTRQIRAK